MRRILYLSLIVIVIFALLPPRHVDASPLSPDDDAWHPIESSQYGEAWYFDAEFTNGYYFSGSIAIFGNISNDAVIQVKFTISPPDHDSVLVFQSYSMEDFQASQTECNVTVGNNKISGVWPYYSLSMTNGTVAVDLNYVAEVEGWKTCFPSEDKEARYSWVVPVPRATAKGQLRIGSQRIVVEGEGYHDHNLKYGPIKDVYGWYWGRVFSGQFTVVWSQIMLSYRTPLVGFVMISEGEKVIGNLTNIQLLPERYMHENSTQGYVPTAYELKGRTTELSGYTIRLQLKMRLDEQGILIATKDKYFQSNCTLYRLRVQVEGMLWLESFSTRIESVDIMEFMKFSRT